MSFTRLCPYQRLYNYEQKLIWRASSHTEKQFMPPNISLVVIIQNHIGIDWIGKVKNLIIQKDQVRVIVTLKIFVSSCIHQIWKLFGSNLLEKNQRPQQNRLDHQLRLVIVWLGGSDLPMIKWFWLVIKNRKRHRKILFLSNRAQHLHQVNRHAATIHAQKWMLTKLTCT